MDKGINVDNKLKKFIDEEYLTELEYMVEELIKEFEYAEFEYNIEIDGFEVTIEAKPKNNYLNELGVTVEYFNGKNTQYTWFSIWKLENTNNTIFSFMFNEIVLVTIATATHIKTQKDVVYAIIPKLEKITIYIHLRHQYITLTIN